MTAADKIAEALLPCPFCGCPDVVIFQEHAENTGSAELSGYYISHPLWQEYPETWGCQAIPSTAYFATRSEAAAAWNRRAAAAPAAEQMSKYRSLIESLRTTVLWGNANPDVMKAAEAIAALADLADALAQENAKLTDKAVQAASDALLEMDLRNVEVAEYVAARIRAALGETP